MFKWRTMSIFLSLLLLLHGVFSDVILPTEYDIIGPFVMGEREEGIDSLESYGGIFNLKPDNTTYPSELGNGGVVGWTKAIPNQNSVQISYPEISWAFLQSVFGWSIWLWYGYALSEFQVTTAGRYLVQCTGVRHFWIDEIPFLGDFYSYGVGGYPISLDAGQHTIIIRLASSVRLTQSPVVNFAFQVTPVTSDVVIIGDVTDPSIVNGYFVTPYLSVAITNTATDWLSDVVLTTRSDKLVAAPFAPVDIAPGQKFSLSIQLDTKQAITCPFYELFYIDYPDAATNPFVNVSFTCTTFGSSAYDFTFLDYDNTVQYASVVPPVGPCPSTGCSVLLATHGAGVEAGSPAWTGAIPQMNNLWLLFPTGRRSWGYDWESSSRVDAFVSLNVLGTTLPGVPADRLTSLVADTNKILYVGHSMGGHGCWSLASHFGDKATAAACAAGFVKLQFYVFYNMKAGDSYIDPVLKGILDASIAENDNDIYTPNLVGIPIIARYGQNDSNVCPWHSRRMARMVDESSHSPSAVIISEVPNENHWFNGVLGDQFMVSFYQNNSNNLPALPDTFTVTTANPASFGGRGNLVILQLSIPYRLGKITVVQGKQVWTLTTTNVRRFGISTTPARSAWPQFFNIDGIQFSAETYLPKFTFCELVNTWQVCTDEYAAVERSPTNYGPFRQIFETDFVISYGTQGNADETLIAFEGAVTIANFFYMYGRGSPLVVPDTILPTNFTGKNALIIGGPHLNRWSQYYEKSYPLKFEQLSSSFTLGPKSYTGPCQGTLFLSPSQTLPNFLAVVAGTDVCGLEVALRGIPQRSGIVVPDYVVYDRSFIGRGSAGILAAGYWDNNWQFSYSSGYA